MKNKGPLLLAAFTIALFGSLSAQLIEVPLEKRIANSAVIIEAEVVHSYCFWGDNRRIYSSHTVRIDKVMKGMPSADTLEIILEGGVVDGHYWEVTHCLALGPKMRGVFFLNPLGAMHPAKQGRERVAYDVYSSMQGFIEYTARAGTNMAWEPFRTYKSIDEDLYPLLGWNKGGAPVMHRFEPSHTLGGPTIDSIRPLEVTAGTRTVLNIHGHGFQAEKGTVMFPNANQGGVSYMFGDSSDIQSWNDTMIQVWVPSAGSLPFMQGTAGTGQVKVKTSIGDSVLSSEELQVRFAVRNGRNLDTIQPLGRSRFVMLFDLDSEVLPDTSGGYTFRFSDGFAANDSAEAVFRQGIKQWRCATGVNFKIGADTALSVIENDFVNLVRWDDSPDSLPTGVPALTRIYFVPCADFSEVGYVISGIDITFNDDMPWNYDTTSIDANHLDFYSVALHEIGHGHGLNHVIDTSEVMHYNIGFGERRALLTTSALDGGHWIMDSSTVARGNCFSPMVPVSSADCNILPVANPEDKSTVLLLFPNPTSGLLHLQIKATQGSQQFGLMLFDSKGNAIAENRYLTRSSSANSWEVDLHGLPSGLYFIHVQMGRVRTTHKVILVR